MKEDPMRRIGKKEPQEDIEVNLSDIISVLNERIFILETKQSALERKIVDLEEGLK